MKEIWRTPIEDRFEFNVHGGVCRRVSYNPDTNVYVYERSTCIEVVKPKYVRQPDGTRVGIYPSDEDFGTYGYCISSNAWYKDQMVEFLVNNPDKWGAQDIYEFKKTLKYDKRG